MSSKLPADVLTTEEVAYIIGQCPLNSATGIRNRAMLTLLYRSGLRVGELLALRPSSLDHDRRAIRVLHGKGDAASTRYWHASADDALARWIDKRKALGLNGGPLFCTLHGGPIADAYMRGLVRRLATECGIEKRVHPHIFRHTFAFELERAGTPVSTISKLLGHKRISTTAIYLDHLTNRQAGEDLQGIALPPFGVDW
jgi:site-specific recombinase XerD